MYSICNDRVMIYETSLCSLIVIRSDDEQSVCAESFRLLRKKYRGISAVAPGACHHRYSVIDMLYTEIYDPDVLLFAEAG